MFDLIDEDNEKSQEEALIKLSLRHGSGIQGGKIRIYEKYQENPTKTEYANFLKKEYGTGGWSGPNIESQMHDAKGIRIESGDKQTKVTLRWNDVAEYIADMIDDGEYFTPQEQEAYNLLLQESEERKNAESDEERIQIITRQFLSHALPKTWDGYGRLVANDFRESENFIKNHTEELIASLEQQKEVVSAKIDGFYGINALHVEFDHQYCPRLQPKEEEKVDEILPRSLDDEEDEDWERAIESGLIKPIERVEEKENTNLEELGFNQNEFGGAKQRYRKNVEAIKLVNQLYQEDREPTDSEKIVLASYVGWGGIPQAFDENNEKWQAEYKELKELLTQDEYDTAKGSVLNAHFTAKEVIGGIYKALYRMGVRGNNKILEPALGTGNFFGFMPEEISENARLYGVELDGVTGRIASKLYPQAHIQILNRKSTFSTIMPKFAIIRCIWKYCRKQVMGSVKEIESEFSHLLERLAASGITYHLIDESILENHGKIVENALQVGNCRYDTIIVPDMPSIASSTLALLKEFKGKLLNLASLIYVDGKEQSVSLPSNISFEEIARNTTVRVRNAGGRYALNVRKGDIGEFIFIKNISNEEACSFEIENFEEYRALDLTTLTLRRIEKHNVIEGLGSLILRKDDTPCEKTGVLNSVDITDSVAVKAITENYLVLDQVCYSFDGVEYTEKMPVQQAFENLLRADYKGKLFVKYDFEVKNLVNAKLLLEKANYESFTVNGRNVEFAQSDFDFLFQEGDISKYLRLGKNEIVYSMEYYQHDGVHFALFDPMATESVKNCLYYDTSIENIYVYGDFSLNERYALCEKKLPPSINGIEKQGYPFFKGKVVYAGKYNYSGKGNALLTLDGDYLVAHVAANGKTKEIVMDTTVDITDLLKKGENSLEITIHTSLRNTFGPHHIEWFYITTPYSFTFRGQWENGTPSNYIDDYQLVNVGIKKIEIKETK